MSEKVKTKKTKGDKKDVERLVVMLRFITLFLILSVALHLLIGLDFDLYWLRRIYALSTYYILKPLTTASVKGTTISAISLQKEVLMVNISKDCTGWKSFIALVALILSTPPSFLKTKRAYLFLLLTPFVVFLITLIRISSSILLSLLLSPNYFEIIHGVLWKALSVLIVVGVWWVWVKRANKLKK